MHIVHIIASEGDNADEARSNAEEGIEHYGNGDVWDWYEIGGRWDRCIGATYGETEADFVPGTNQLCYAENPELFNKTIDDAVSGRAAEFLEALQAVRGDLVGPELVPDHVLGMPVTDKEATAARVSLQNQELGSCWNALLACNTADDLAKVENMKMPGSLVFYKVYKLMKGLMGYYDFDSRFYDTGSGSTRREYVDERKGTAPNRQWITVFDLHN